MDTVPKYNPRVRYGKGKYNNDIKNSHPTKYKEKKERPKSVPQRKKYKARKRLMTTEDGVQYTSGYLS